MNPKVKIYRPMRKVKISGGTVRKLARDLKANFADVKTAHAESIGINYRSYVQILESGEARPDIIAKVETYLKQVA